MRAVADGEGSTVGVPERNLLQLVSGSEQGSIAGQGRNVRRARLEGDPVDVALRLDDHRRDRHAGGATCRHDAGQSIERALDDGGRSVPRQHSGGVATTTAQRVGATRGPHGQDVDLAERRGADAQRLYADRLATEDRCDHVDSRPGLNDRRPHLGSLGRVHRRIAEGREVDRAVGQRHPEGRGTELQLLILIGIDAEAAAQ